MRRGERAFNLPSSVLWLSVVLLAVHGIRAIVSPDADETVVLALAFIPARYGEAADFLPGGWGARFWSPLTYAFLHADILRLGVNLVWMASFGSALAGASARSGSSSSQQSPPLPAPGPLRSQIRATGRSSSARPGRFPG